MGTLELIAKIEVAARHVGCRAACRAAYRAARIRCLSRALCDELKEGVCLGGKGGLVLGGEG